MVTKKLFSGVFPFLVTPFTEDHQEVDAPRLRSHIENLIKTGRVHGITALGSTGEYASLSESERQLVMETTIDAARKRVPVIIGASAITTRLSVALAKAAERAGADAIVVNPQSYWVPTEQELFDHYGALARAIDIPILVYNSPGTTKVDMSAKFIARLHREFSNCVAVKDSSGDIRRVQDILELTHGEMSVSIGRQSLALAAFATGATFWTTGIANTIPTFCADVYEEAVVRRNFDAARTLFRRILPLCDFFAEKSLCRSVKAAAELMGRGLGPPRLPLQHLAAADYEALEKLLVECGVMQQRIHAAA